MKDNLKNFNERELNLVDAIYQAANGEEVYNALSLVPSENLKHIVDMIDHIITYRNSTGLEERDDIVYPFTSKEVK